MVLNRNPRRDELTILKSQVLFKLVSEELAKELGFYNKNDKNVKVIQFGKLFIEEISNDVLGLEYRNDLEIFMIEIRKNPMIARIGITAARDVLNRFLDGETLID